MEAAEIIAEDRRGTPAPGGGAIETAGGGAEGSAAGPAESHLDRLPPTGGGAEGSAAGGWTTAVATGSGGAEALQDGYVTHRIVRPIPVTLRIL